MSKTEMPSIRFYGFDNDWEQRKLGDDLVSIHTGTNLLGSITNTGMPLIKMGNIQRGYFDTSKVEFLAENEQPDKADIANYGDFFFNTRNTFELVGKGATWMKNSGEYAFNSNIARFELRNLDTIFFNYLYNTDYMTKQIHARAMGTTSVAAIYPRTLDSVEYLAPCMKEQQKIGAYFKQLDHLITLHQRKFEKLTNVKKSMLEKMFPRNGSCYPEIRFKGFTDPWEQRKFSEITFLSGEKNRENLPLESYSITNESGFVPQDEKFENGGTMREADKRMYYIVSPNSFAYNPARINVGSIGYQNTGKNVIVSSLYEIFKTSDDVDDRLLWHWFKSPDFQKLIWQLQEGGVRLYFYYDKLCMGEVSLPSLEEQRKIGKFFDTLDNLITLHQREVEKLQSIKKALLEKMFV